MARNRQRAKQRQAERRAARLAEREQAAPEGARPRRAGAEPPTDATPPTRARPDGDRSSEGNGSTSDDGARAEVDLAAGAPPEDVGRTDTVLESPPPPPDLRDEEIAEEEAPEEVEDELVEDEAPAARAPGSRGRRGREEHKDRPRFIQFLFNVWAELQRVQWPNRQALTTLTGVVLGFVLIAGGYLGLLDAIFSRVIQAIL
jgi:preprotein translocase subunit SecE